MNDLLKFLEALQRQLSHEYIQAPGLFREMAQIEDLLAETYRTRAVYELLQNSDDAHSTHVVLDLRNPDRIIWENDGRPFEERDLESLCRSASSSKDRLGATIGHRGIGFKSVAALSDNVRVDSSQVFLRFNRQEASDLIGSSIQSTPLLRVPAEVGSSSIKLGAKFTIHVRNDASDQIELDPLAILFLRHIKSIVIRRPQGDTHISTRLQEQKIVLRINDADASFHRSSAGDTVLLIPADAHARGLTGRRGKLFCFLPLSEELGLPAIASGPVMTDPSRTHATLAAPETALVLQEISEQLAQVLTNPSLESCDSFWKMLISGEDLRTMALDGDSTIPGKVLTLVKEYLKQTVIAFKLSEIPLEEQDLHTLFPEGAPSSLYSEDAISKVRSLRVVFGLPLATADDIEHSVSFDLLDPKTKERLWEVARQKRELTGQTLGVPIPQSNFIQGQVAEPNQDGQRIGTKSEIGAIGFADVVARWRAVEIATKEHLNAQGWHLEDVSRQNVGYDLTGKDPNGVNVRIEVKKVDGYNSSFSLTNNEMSVMIADQCRYFLAIIIGNGSATQLAIIDPLDSGIPRERVCRRWEWEYSDWARFAKVIG